MTNTSSPSIPASHPRNSMRVKSGPIAVSLACLVLAGCNQGRFPDVITTGSVFGASKDTAYAHVLAERRPVQEAMVNLPLRAGSPLEVVQSRAGNGLKQRIVLQGDALASGQNTVDVRMVVKEVWPKRKKEGLALHSSSIGAIKAQMRDALPGISMRMSNELNTNAYGPFGYALGRAPGNVRCIFGWQNVEGTGHEPWGIFTKKSKRPELSVRVRICRGDVNSEQLVSLLSRIRIDADPNRVTEPQAVSWRAGEGNDIQSFVGTSSQGYVSQKPRVSYQPEGGYEPEAEKAPAQKKIVVKRAPVKRKTQTAVRRTPTVKNTRVAATPNVVLPTPQHVNVVGTQPNGQTIIQRPVIAAVPAIQPKTSLITLPGQSSTQTSTVTTVTPTIAPVVAPVTAQRSPMVLRKPQETAVIYNAPAVVVPSAPESGKLVLPLPN